MDPRAQKIGVVVSTVSTKLPFVSMGKESLSADVADIAVVIRVRRPPINAPKVHMHPDPTDPSAQHALQQCAAQLRTKLARLESQRNLQQRTASVAKLIPDVARALVGVLRRTADGLDGDDPEVRLTRVRRARVAQRLSRGCERGWQRVAKRQRLDGWAQGPPPASAVLAAYTRGDLTEETLHEALERHVHHVRRCTCVLRLHTVAHHRLRVDGIGRYIGARTRSGRRRRTKGPAKRASHSISRRWFARPTIASSMAFPAAPSFSFARRVSRPRPMCV
jgi:hypothetical protein